MITIFTYDRQPMLQRLCAEIEAYPIFKNEDVTIIDDGTPLGKECLRTPSHWYYIDFPHSGKVGFWERWSYALQQCYGSDDDFFMFMPDDYSHVDFERIIHNWKILKLRHSGKMYKPLPFVCNIVNDGRGPNWTKFKEQPYSENLTRIDWTDCGFFCNRAALEAIGFHMFPIPASRFKRKNISSGVGQQLTQRFNAARVPIYRPIKSFAFHGDHPSMMHPEERLIHPLTSK